MSMEETHAAYQRALVDADVAYRAGIKAAAAPGPLGRAERLALRREVFATYRAAVAEARQTWVRAGGGQP